MEVWLGQAEGRCGLYRNAPGVNLVSGPTLPPRCEWPNMKTLCPFVATAGATKLITDRDTWAA